MLARNRRWTAHKATWSWVGIAAAVALLLTAFAAPMSAAATSTTHLTNASVTPRSGNPTTKIAITVVYRNDAGSRADKVTVSVGAQDHAMARTGAEDWVNGVTFKWTGTAKVGSQAVVVTARAKDHSTATLEAGKVIITKAGAPTPMPTPTKTPTPAATPKATPRPSPKPTARTTPRATPRPTTRPVRRTAPKPTVVPNAVRTQPPAPSFIAMPTGEAGSPTSSGLPVIAAIAGAAGAAGAAGGSAPGSGPGRGGSRDDIPTKPAVRPGGSGGGWGPVAGVLAMAGLRVPTFPTFALAPTLVTTTGAVTTAMAFGLFGRRRRDDDLSDDALSAAAASGLAVAPHQLVGTASQEWVPASGIGAGLNDRPPSLPQPGDVADPVDLESLMPRWRRPSLIQARKADPVRDVKTIPRLTFDHGLVGPLAGHERRVIRYRVVRLLDSPDELRGAEIGYLDEGDEVQLIEKYGAYWLVMSPDGQQGWLHKMTLGEAVAERAAPDLPVATMPSAADSWTMGESDVDGDVFDAYLESRRRDG